MKLINKRFVRFFSFLFFLLNRIKINYALSDLLRKKNIYISMNRVIRSIRIIELTISTLYTRPKSHFRVRRWTNHDRCKDCPSTNQNYGRSIVHKKISIPMARAERTCQRLNCSEIQPIRTGIRGVSVGGDKVRRQAVSSHRF